MWGIIVESIYCFKLHICMCLILINNTLLKWMPFDKISTIDTRCDPIRMYVFRPREKLWKFMEIPSRFLSHKMTEKQYIDDEHSTRQKRLLTI